MGNKGASPLPPFDLASSQLGPLHVAQYRAKFNKFAEQKSTITKTAFAKAMGLLPSCKLYFCKNIAPRLFTLVDTKRDDVWDFEEYLSAVAVFKIGQPEEKIKMLYLLYADSKSPAALSRDHLRNLLIDSIIVLHRNETPQEGQQQKWAEDLKELSEGLAAAAFYQFASQEQRMDFQEFVSFFKHESSLQGLLTVVQMFLELGGDPVGPLTTQASQLPSS